MSRSHKHLEILFSILEQGEPVEILTPSISAARTLRSGLYKARSRLRAKSETLSTPFDHFIIGIKNTTILVDPTPPMLTQDIDIVISPSSSLPVRGGSRPPKPE